MKKKRLKRWLRRKGLMYKKRPRDKPMKPKIQSTVNLRDNNLKQIK